MNTTSIRPAAVKACYLLIGILLIIWPALYNGYPLVYSDTGVYLRTSILMETPPDRPIGYGIFIRIVTWQATTWPVIFAQGFIIYCLTWRIIKLFFRKYPRLLHLGVLAVLGTISSLPWYAAQLMPDIFSGIIVLTVFLFFYDTVGWKGRMAYGLLIGFFTIFHYSFLLIVIPVGTLLVLLRIRRLFSTEKKLLYRYGAFVGFFTAALLIVMAINYSEKGKFRLSFSSNVYLVAKFCDGDILKTYLQDNCGKKDVIFCELKDSIPDSPSAFLWNDNYPFLKRYRMQWGDINDRCGNIVHDVLTTSKYRNLFIREAFRATIAQLQQNAIGSGLVQYGGNRHSPGDMIYTEFERDFPAYIHSRQNTENMEDLSINRFNQNILIVSTLLIIGGLCYRPSRKKLSDLLLVCLSGVVINAFITAALANVYDRLQARITWLLVFGALIVIAFVIFHLSERRKMHAA